MNAVSRTKNLCTLLGWQGGTVHDACKQIGVSVPDFLYVTADFDEYGPCAEFRRGYEDTKGIKERIAHNKGCLQYWFGAISFVQNQKDQVNG